VERRELILAILGRVAAVHTHLHSAEQQHPGHTKLNKRELHSCVLVFQRIRDNDRWRRAASSGFLGGHWSLGQEVRASVLFLDLVGKDGVPACSDGRHMPSYMREAGGLTKACRVVA